MAYENIYIPVYNKCRCWCCHFMRYNLEVEEGVEGDGEGVAVALLVVLTVACDEAEGTDPSDSTRVPRSFSKIKASLSSLGSNTCNSAPNWAYFWGTSTTEWNVSYYFITQMNAHQNEGK